MKNKIKIAIFDFCETIANFQTADAFVVYVREKTKSKSMCRKEYIRLFLRKTRILAILSILFNHSSINKRLVLWQLKGFSQEIIEHLAEEYYNDKIRPNFIEPVLSRLKELKKEGWRIVVISGGYEIYLRYFCIEFNIRLSDLIAVKIGFNDGLCNGQFDGGDRLWDKVEQLNERFTKSSVDSIAFSDSITDLPLLLWANKSFVVRRKDRQPWYNRNKFQEIIWSQD